MFNSIMDDHWGGAQRSEDLDELLSMCDKIIVIYKGRASQAISEESVDKLKIGAMMPGEGFEQKQIAS